MKSRTKYHNKIMVYANISELSQIHTYYDSEIMNAWDYYKIVNFTEGCSFQI